VTQFTFAAAIVANNALTDKGAPMKTKTKNLLVYRYEFFDERQQKIRTSETYATLDAILAGLGIPLMDSAKVVQRCAVYHELVELD
jgi:hypothetical protein